MLKYKHIVVALDLSPKCEKLLQAVKSMQGEVPSKISVIHAMEHSPVAYAGEFSIPIDTNIEQTLESQARELLDRLLAAYDLAIEKVSIVNVAVKIAVTDFAKEVEADLIVVGSHGHGPLEALLGSRANAILHLAPCDVLVVKL